MTRPSAQKPLSASVLRPLRAKCLALSAVSSTRPLATYSSKALPYHPLDILPSSPSTRLLYAIRDGFRDVILKTQPTPASSRRRVPRLADMCATILGENIQGDEGLPLGDADAEMERFAEVESFYDLVPVENRRSALIAHALDLVLRCQRHVTLLSILLDVTLHYGLLREACILLHRLLMAAVSSGSLPLCHPAHTNFLVDLYRKWQGGGRSTSVFVKILGEILVDAPGSVWRCKALAKFARELHGQDAGYLVDMVSQLVSSLAVERTERCNPHWSPVQDPCIRAQLDSWLNLSAYFPSQDLAPILDFLDQCYRSGADGPADSLSATISCWATHCLSVSSLSPNHRASISRLLKRVSPSVSTYKILVEEVLGLRRSRTVHLLDIRAAFETYASCLRAENLLLLEASLWACALRCVEGSFDLLAPSIPDATARRYQEELMDLVEDAENRCFGAGATNSSPRSSACGWVREEVLGCWALQRQATPVKRLKIDHQRGRPVRFATNSAHNASPPSPSFELSFRSLISSALSNRTRLTRTYGVEYTRTSPPPSRNCDSESDCCVVPSSDDALNLFAYTDPAH